MVYFITALMVEAAPLIDKYKLKRDMSLNEFQVFRNEDISLIVTGVGKIKAAMGTVFLFSKYGVGIKDIVINFGLCGCSKLPTGSFAIASKITDSDTKRDYYPDVLVNGYSKRALKCYSHVVTRSEIDEDVIVDMESSGIMEAVYKFIYSHQIVICKIVSDNLSNEKLDVLFIQSLINKNIHFVDDIIEQSKKIVSSVNVIDLQQEEEYIDILKDNLKLTEALSNILRSNVKKAKIKGIDVKIILESYLDITAASKYERKRIFDELSKELN